MPANENIEKRTMPMGGCPDRLDLSPEGHANDFGGKEWS